MTSIFQLSHEERAKIMAENPPEIEPITASGYFNWGWKGCGFGQLSFSRNYETGEWSCSTEMMGPERVRTLLHAFADHIADSLTPVIEAEEQEWANRRAMFAAQEPDEEA